MPGTSIHSCTLPVSLFMGRTDVEVITEVLKNGTLIEQVGPNFNYFCDGIKGSGAVESDGLTVTIYLTEPNAAKREFLSTFEPVEPTYLWNIFHPHRPHRWEDATQRTWCYVLAAPRLSKADLPEYQIRRFSREGLVGKFLFSDWLFSAAGGPLSLSEVYQIAGSGSLSKKEGNLSIVIRNY